MSKAMDELKRLLGAELGIKEGVEVLHTTDEKQQKYTAPTEPDIEDVEQAVESLTDKIDVVDVTSLPQAREVARRTRELLNSQGWCLWKCSTLDGEVIAVVRDEDVKGVPQDYPVYTELELKELCHDDVSDITLRLTHEARKLAGAKVTTEVTK